MNKTKIKKALSVLAVGALVATQVNVFAATNIGIGTVDSQPAFDTNIVWDDNFPGSATGTVTGIKVLATVAPTINMTLSTNEINLGTLIAGTPSTGSINIEVGTNAARGVTITAQSGSGGLTNKSNNSLQINNSAADGNAESYTFGVTSVDNDSSFSSFAQTAGTLGVVSATERADNSLLTIYETNGPEATDATADLTFEVTATSNAQTAAGDYQDEVSFTIVGNF